MDLKRIAHDVAVESGMAHESLSALTAVIQEGIDRALAARVSPDREALARDYAMQGARYFLAQYGREDHYSLNEEHLVEHFAPAIALAVTVALRLPAQAEVTENAYGAEVERRIELESRHDETEAEYDRLRQALKLAAGRLRWAATARPGVSDPMGSKLVLDWAADALSPFETEEGE